MDQQALKLIQETALNAEGMRKILTHKPVAALPNDYILHDLEPYEQYRSQFRGIFSTNAIAALAFYIEAEKIKQSANGGEPLVFPGFVDVDAMAARVFFDLNVIDAYGKFQAGHALHQAILQLKKTAEHAAVLRANGSQFTQADLIEWLEDWHPNVFSLADEQGQPVTPVSAIAAIRRLEITTKSNSSHTTEALRAERTALEQVEARGAGQLPTRIVFNCVPYPGLPRRDFPIRLSVITSHDKPRLVLRIVNLEAIAEAIAEDFRTALAAAIGGAATLTLGTFKP